MNKPARVATRQEMNEILEALERQHEAEVRKVRETLEKGNQALHEMFKQYEHAARAALFATTQHMEDIWQDGQAHKEANDE